MNVAGVVLAAGLSSRFGDSKALAVVGGRPLLQHVLAAVRACAFAETVVVLGADADRIEHALEWHGEWIVRNPDPGAGLAGSLRLGFAALGRDVDAACIFLGDQPLVRPSVVAALLEARTPAAPIVVPRYGGGGGHNPVLIDRAAWSLLAETSGDRGLGPIIAAHPELVREVVVEGANPDVDTHADLAAVAAAIETATGPDSRDT